MDGREDGGEGDLDSLKSMSLTDLLSSNISELSDEMTALLLLSTPVLRVCREDFIESTSFLNRLRSLVINFSEVVLADVLMVSGKSEGTEVTSIGVGCWVGWVLVVGPVDGGLRTRVSE